MTADYFPRIRRKRRPVRQHEKIALCQRVLLLQIVKPDKAGIQGGERKSKSRSADRAVLDCWKIFLIENDRAAEALHNSGKRNRDKQGYVSSEVCTHGVKTND